MDLRSYLQLDISSKRSFLVNWLRIFFVLLVFINKIIVQHVGVRRKVKHVKMEIYSLPEAQPFWRDVNDRIEKYLLFQSHYKIPDFSNRDFLLVSVAKRGYSASDFFCITSEEIS